MFKIQKGIKEIVQIAWEFRRSSCVFLKFCYCYWWEITIIFRKYYSPYGVICLEFSLEFFNPNGNISKFAYNPKDTKLYRRFKVITIVKGIIKGVFVQN